MRSNVQLLVSPALALAASAGFAAPHTTTVPSPDGVNTGSVGHVLPAEPEVVEMRSPTKDTSTYANIGAGGNTREYAWLSYYPGEGRQSSLLAMYDTASAGAITGPDAQRIRITAAELTIVTFPSGPRAGYDPTPDPWQSTLWEGGDLEVFEDLGGTHVIGTVFVPSDPRYVELDEIETGNRPVEVFGVRFNNGLTAETWNESSGGTGAWGNGQYNAEPIDFDETGAERPVFFSFGESAVEFAYGPFLGDDGVTYPDVYYPTGALLDNPIDGFDPRPFALGRSYSIPDGTAGHSIFGEGQDPIELGDLLPAAHRLRCPVRVKDPGVQTYIREGLEEGWVSFIFSQLAFGVIGGTREYSYWLTKEGAASLPPVVDLDPCTLRIEYTILPAGDLDGNGMVTTDDLVTMIGAFTDFESYRDGVVPGLDARALADVNTDGSFDVGDVLELLNILADSR